MNQAIDITGLSKRFGTNTVLKDLNWQVEAGTVIGLLGVNGAGKTTLIQSITGLHHPDDGSVSVLKEDPMTFSDTTKHRLGYVPQTTDDFGWMKVKELLQFTASFYDHWNHEKIEALRERWSLRPNARVDSLSVGQRQRLSILRALGHEPDLLILDEPVAALDPVGRRDFLRELLDLALQDDKTVVFSTHITSDLERIAAEVAILHDGQVALSQSLDEVKDSVVRLRVDASSDLPEMLPIAHTLSCRVQKNQAVLTVRKFDEQVIPELERQLGARISKEPLSLEDIFLELTRNGASS